MHHPFRGILYRLLYVMGATAILLLVYLFDFGGIRQLPDFRSAGANGVSRNVEMEIP